MPVDDLLSATAPPPQNISWRVVTATGQFDPARQVYVRLRQDSAGQPVSEVIAPFRLTSGETLLVDRGYVSFADVRAEANRSRRCRPGTSRSPAGFRMSRPTRRTGPPVLVDGRIEVYAINSGRCSRRRPAVRR